MKDKIIEILKSESFSIINEEGQGFRVIESDDFEDVADRIVELLNNNDKNKKNEEHNVENLLLSEFSKRKSTSSFAEEMAIRHGKVLNAKKRRQMAKHRSDSFFLGQ